MSPGNLYRYCRQEEIIAAVAERDPAPMRRSNSPPSARAISSRAFSALAHHHLVDRSVEEVALLRRDHAESRRNAKRAYLSGDGARLRARFLSMLAAPRSAAKSAATLDLDGHPDGAVRAQRAVALRRAWSVL